MSGPQTWPCHACGNIGLSDGDDGFYYCLRCGARAEDIIETGVADEDFVDKGGETGHALYLASHSRRRNLATIKAEPLSQPLSDTPNPLFLWSSLTLEAEGTLKTQQQIKTEEYLDDGVGPSGPEDFGYSSAKGVAPGFDDYYNEIRMRYMMGMQLMIQFQCEALVRGFNASPLICGLAGTLWLQFVAVTGVFDDDWADQTIQDSEIQTTEELEDLNRRAKHRAEPRNIRRCKIRAPCCNEIYPCRHCHNEATSMRTSPFDRHELVRFDVKQVVCSVCDTEQPVAQVCTNCGVNMGSISAMFANSMMTIPRKVSSVAQTVGTIRKSCIAKPPREHKAG